MHYVTWNSTSSDKFALANFAPDDCNYDFLSIAEASRVLKKHPAKHKILVVLSDGAPCNRSSDKGRMDAVMATALAVSQAEKIADVLGVAMNCYDPNAYATMYGKDYISVLTANDMFLPISVALRQIVKKW
jgi:nitric oxide reductase activation protein